MTVERIEGTAEADNAAAEADTASQATAGAEVSQTPAEETAATAQATETAAEVAEATSAVDEPANDTTTATLEQDVEAAAVDSAEVAAATADEPAQAGDGMVADDEAPSEPETEAQAEAAVDATDEPAMTDADLETAPAAVEDEPAVDVESVVDEAPARASAPTPRVYEGPEPTTMEELLNEQQTEIRSLKHGDVVEGSVVRIDKDEILVDIGAKSEGVISNRELYGRNTETQPELNIGDVVLVYVLQPESPEGHAVLSLRRAGLERKWRAMQEQLDAGAIIEAPVIDHNKGGLIVDCGIRGFVPISQIVDFPRRPQNEQPRDAAQEIAEKLQPYVGRKLRLKILEVNRKANRLILSEKVALYEERREKRDELFSSLQVGQKVTGTVRSIAPFGVFIDLGGIDGLVHKSELSWNKVNNPESGYRVGEEVEAEVIDINHERGRISLSIRRLQPDPWHSTVADLKVGDVIDGTVTKIVNFGAFVRVRDGLEGLIHISELSHARVAHPGDVVHEGQTIKLKIISLEQERHRLGLSLKQAEEAPARPERPAAPRERRGRSGERGYDMSQAVQEPEGGIDNTLAAAFAQVRQQIVETEAARGSADADEDETEAAPAAEEIAEAPAAEVATADEEAPTAADVETADEEAPAAEVATADEEAPAAEAPAAEASPVAEAEATDVIAQAEEPAVAAETDDAPALEVGAAEPAGKPSRRGKAKADSADEESSSDEPAAEAAAAEPEADEALPTTASDPAEGAEDAAPAEGADRDEPAS